MTMNTETKPAFEGWCVLELMGHRKLAGYVQQVEVAGTGMLRIDVPAAMSCAECRDGKEAVSEAGPGLVYQDRVAPPLPCPKCSIATQFYSPSALYCLTPTTEALCRRMSANHTPTPVQRYELPAAPQAARLPDGEDDYDSEIE